MHQSDDVPSGGLPLHRASKSQPSTRRQDEADRETSGDCNNHKLTGQSQTRGYGHICPNASTASRGPRQTSVVSIFQFYLVYPSDKPTFIHSPHHQHMTRHVNVQSLSARRAPSFRQPSVYMYRTGLLTHPHGSTRPHRRALPVPLPLLREGGPSMRHTLPRRIPRKLDDSKRRDGRAHCPLGELLALICRPLANLWVHEPEGHRPAHPAIGALDVPATCRQGK